MLSQHEQEVRPDHETPPSPALYGLLLLARPHLQHFYNLLEESHVLESKLSNTCACSRHFILKLWCFIFMEPRASSHLAGEDSAGGPYPSPYV